MDFIPSSTQVALLLPTSGQPRLRQLSLRAQQCIALAIAQAVQPKEGNGQLVEVNSSVNKNNE